MDNYPPHVDVFPNDIEPPLDFNRRPWLDWPRFKIFASVFCLSVAASLTYTYSRPAIYRSSATLLTSAMTAIDRNSNAADVQHVVIQKQILLGDEVLEATLSQLKATSEPNPFLLQLTLSDIRNLLDVEPVNKTNLIEIRAEGTDPKWLPRLINTWIDVYLKTRTEDIKKSTENTSNIIEGELEGLVEKINDARARLANFREENDILTTDQNENEELARLKGLSDSLNKANEEEIKAKAHFDALKAAITNGLDVVSGKDQNGLEPMLKRLQELREKLAELDQRFTRDYLKLQPKLKVIPEQIKKLEADIADKRLEANTDVLIEAENAYTAARQTVKELRTQLDAHKRQAARFTAKFAENETLKADLDGLEKLYRSKTERLVQIETSHKEKYPQVTVINRASPSHDPIRPHYNRDAMISIFGSLLLGLFAVWIVEYLTRKQAQPMPTITLSGIPVYRPASERIDYQDSIIQPLGQQQNNALAAPSHRELSSHQLRVLLNAATLTGKQLIGLLLSGLTLEEAASLKMEQVNLPLSVITITRPVLRSIGISRPLKALFEQSGGYPAWVAAQPAAKDTLAVSLSCAANDSGLASPEDITEATIRHSYILYLARQGLRLADIEHIVGFLDPEAIAYYGSYCAPHQSRGIDEVELLHPALIGLNEGERAGRN